ncbi:UvrB/UvrC motif-containing protein [Cytobacillus oceanisediminis]|uniref:Protein arginine kinase activator n=1 Tax=Cytobacillus oceanisediminis TaxID=665099 RepID=A0A562J6E8_9BACI|nr:UvrB/UvrC motif-containing protein [Cytobacillus oceanisediminis]TWH78778.1 protein arginine kinase activator [Cytobacillus oceanisediminis]
MICQECNQRPATLHFTKVVNGEKAEFHLCEKCAQEKGEMFMLGSGSGFSINNLLAGLLNIEPAFQGSKQDPFQQEKVLQCEQCSMTFQQFIKVGRFGCAHCYETFKDHLKPILRRLHSGNSSHNGKIPARIGGTIHLRRNIDELKHKLKEMIAQEEFEKAAELRDEIRKLEKQLNANHEGGD